MLGETFASAQSPATSNAYCVMWNSHRYKVPFPGPAWLDFPGSLYISTSQNVKLDGPKNQPKTLPFEGPSLGTPGFQNPPAPDFPGAEPGKRLDRSCHHQRSGTFDLGRCGAFNGDAHQMRIWWGCKWSCFLELSGMNRGSICSHLQNMIFVIAIYRAFIFYGIAYTWSYLQS